MLFSITGLERIVKKIFSEIFVFLDVSGFFMTACPPRTTPDWGEDE
jgi:hypothetical protein